MNNLIVVKIDPAGQVEVFALNPAHLQVVVVRDENPVWSIVPLVGEKMGRFSSKGAAAYKARKLKLFDYTIEQITPDRVSIELPQVLTRLDQADLESIQKVLKG